MFTPTLNIWTLGKGHSLKKKTLKKSFTIYLEKLGIFFSIEILCKYYSIRSKLILLTKKSRFNKQTLGQFYYQKLAIKKSCTFVLVVNFNQLIFDSIPKLK